MEPILTREDMVLTDKAMMNDFHVSENVLIERAAMAARDIIISSEYNFNLERILVVCGRGNNGADGLAVARLLFELNKSIKILICDDINKASQGFINQYNIVTALDMDIIFDNGSAVSFNPTIIVDAIFGISLSRNIEGHLFDTIQMMNNLRKDTSSKIISLDVPSGICSNSGQVKGIAIKADVTVTFGYRKIGCLLYPGASYCGKLIYNKSGFFDNALRINTRINILEDNEIKLPQRPSYSNKGTFGKLLLIAGSEDICGAAILSGLAAMRSGLGMIKIITSANNKSNILNALPEAMLITYSDHIDDKIVNDAISWCDSVAIGPGISTSLISKQLVKCVFEANVPIIADADALNILSKCPDYLKNHSSPVIITPHLGEMSRLSKLSIKEISDNLIKTAVDFAKKYNIIVVLKDARTIIATPDAEIIININGNSGMATAGSGDVLTGIIGALLASGITPFYAAALGTAIHAKAGDYGSFELGEHRLLAGDIINYV